MIPIIIAIVCTIIGMIIFHAVKEDAAYSSGKKFIAYIGVYSPMLSLIGLLGYQTLIVGSEYNYIKEQNIVLNNKILSAKVDNSITNELIDEAEKYNKLCEQYYDTYQSNMKWTLLGNFYKNTLEYKVAIPEATTSTATEEQATTLTTVINGTEYEIVPKE